MQSFKIFKGIHLLFFILICGQKPQSINATKICTESRSEELFADLVCKNPITGESLEDSSRCKRMTSSMTCCCTHASSCEKEDKIISIVDNLFDETFDSDTYEDPAGRTDEFGTYEDSAGRSNEIPDPSGMCPFGMTRCCYNKNEVEMSLIDDCEPIQHQEAEDNFGLCNQGCSAKLPSKMMTFTIAPKPAPAPAPKPAPLTKPKKKSFGAAFGRTETIGVTKQCGHREFDDLNLPKSEVSPGEFPWTCTLWTETNGRDVYLGSCAIIPNAKGNDITEPTRRVITAAHKLKSLTGILKVRIEDANNSDDIVEDIFQEDSDYGASSYDDASGRAAGRSSQISIEKDYLVTDIAEHPDFDVDRLLNDISVLKLQKPIELATSNRVNAACMPGCPNMFDNTFNNGTGVRCWVAGWGQETNKMYQRKVDVPMYPDRNRCEQKLNNKLTQLGYDKIDLHPGEVCAGGELNKDACKGDGGTPLVCQAVSGHWHVVGLVSWGLGCGEDDLPAVYVNVFHYLDFIYSSFADQTWVNIGDFARSQTIG